MKRFVILEVNHLRANEEEKVSVSTSLFNKEIVLPYPEFCTDCIFIKANPIDLCLSEEDEVIGTFSIKENSRTCYFLKPYSENEYRYWESISHNKDYWIPFFPEQKEIIYVSEGSLISFFKDISFNKNWQPISHALYVNRVHTEHSDELDYMEIDVAKYEEVDLEEYELNNTEDNFDVYSTEYFGEIEVDECKDECWACAKLLQKEMLFVIQFTTQKEGKREEHIREVLGLDVKDALDLFFQGDWNIDYSDVTSYRVYHNNELVMHEGSWIKNGYL